MSPEPAAIESEPVLDEDIGQQLRERIVAGNSQALAEWIDTLEPGDRARAVSDLSDEEQAALLQLLRPADAADLIDDLPDEQSADLLEEVTATQAAAIVEELDSDDRADVLAEMQAEDAAAILDALPHDDAEETRELLRYPSDTAGGIMIKEYVAYPRGTTVGEVLDDLRINRSRYESYDVRYFYVTDRRGVLKGVLRLRDMVLSSPDRPIEEVMIPDPWMVHVDDPLNTLQLILETHHFSALPVVDGEGRILGVVIEKEVLEATRKGANKTLLKLAGVFGGEERRSMSSWVRAGRRLLWLLLIMGLSFVSVSSIAFFETTLEKMIALTVFMPIVSNMIGCAGNQAVALSLREMALGMVKPWDLFYVLFKEAKVGVLNGLALGLGLGLIGFLWKGRPELGLIVGGAMACLTVIAVTLGGILPLVLKRLRIDPAIASGPVLTTTMDTMGFFLILSMAAGAIHWMGL